MKQFYLAEIVTKDKLVRQGFVRKPKGKGPFPAVIFVHGLGMTMHEWKNSFDEISERLTAEGFATLQFTFDISKDSEVRELPLKNEQNNSTMLQNGWYVSPLLIHAGLVSLRNRMVWQRLYFLM